MSMLHEALWNLILSPDTEKEYHMSSIFEPIQLEVCQWSKANFGEQQSKVNPDLFLGSLAPLMGMMEELGEWFETEDDDGEKDAIGDIAVYLCDYAGREGFILPDIIIPDNYSPDPVIEATVQLGKLYHCTLKRHQGIRGYDDPAKYHYERDDAVHGLMLALDTYCAYHFDCQLIDILGMTWQAVVAKRNWKTNPTTG